MLTICVAAYNKSDLPKQMTFRIERYHELGYLDGRMCIKDDEVRETCYGWEMRSYWGTPYEVNARERSSLTEAVKEKLYSSEDLRELVSVIWDVFIENYSDVDLFREDVLDVLQGPDVIKGLLCVLNHWSDRLGE